MRFADPADRLQDLAFCVPGSTIIPLKQRQEDVRLPLFHAFTGPARRGPSITLTCALLASAICGGLAPARADATLTLDLPPSRAAQNAAAERAKTPPRAHTSVVPSASHRGRRGRLASRGAYRRERIVGRLGQLDMPAQIFRSPSPGSRLLTSASAGTYVALQGSAGDWYGILMADGSTGWLSKASVRLLDYQVVSNGSSYGSAGSYPQGTSSAMLTSGQEAILREAYRYLGVRYVWGGNTTDGIDCSGFVKNVFAACGYRLPRTATEQMAWGVEVPRDQLQAGDRLYFGHKSTGYGVTHTGIYIGNDYFIHSSSSNRGVAISRLTEPLYARIFVCARR